tara:strand:- start:33 stop:350 length:318 start_codon:yes stop_codon:yes gene_type:complete
MTSNSSRASRLQDMAKRQNTETDLNELRFRLNSNPNQVSVRRNRRQHWSAIQRIVQGPSKKLDIKANFSKRQSKQSIEMPNIINSRNKSTKAYYFSQKATLSPKK